MRKYSMSFLLTLITLLPATVAWSAEAQDSSLSAKVLTQEDGRITFVVDENLTPIEDQKHYGQGEKFLFMQILEDYLGDESSYKRKCIASSFEHDQSMAYMGNDAFFKTLVHAYATHQSVCLSPDMIWLLVCQGFSRYVNAHAEKLRPLLVSHEGKMNLIVETDKPLLSEREAWPQVIDDMTNIMYKHTKEDIAQTIASEFSTTGVTERIASKITLMDTFKSYFNYIGINLTCGIPSITLTGTPADWRSVVERTKKLKKYGLENWVVTLEPILEEFVRAAEGQPNQAFWRGIVKKQRVYKLYDPGCSPGGEPTMLDGWINNFFLDKYGHLPKDVTVATTMPNEMLRVNFLYIELFGTARKPISKYPLELWAGFVGADKDTLTNTLSPKIGWFIRYASK